LPSQSPARRQPRGRTEAGGGKKGSRVFDQERSRSPVFRSPEKGAQPSIKIDGHDRREPADGWMGQIRPRREVAMG
jgi:hypothetical protein